MTKMYPTADAVSGEAKDGLIDLIYRLADDDLILGHRNSVWTGLGPILEADIAMSSLAQDEVGQAVVYYGLLHELGEPDPDTLAFARGPEDYRCASLTALDRGDWAFSTVRQYFYDVYKTHRLASLAESTYEPLAQVARKVRGEQKYHMMHSRMWVSRLGDATDESRERMQKSVDELYAHALGLFESTPFEQVIADQGFCVTESSLLETWRDEVHSMLAQAGLTVPTDAKPVYGGRKGLHGAALKSLLDEMQQVYRLEPTAQW